jgi:hypothetical protein
MAHVVFTQRQTNTEKTVKGTRGGTATWCLQFRAHCFLRETENLVLCSYILRETENPPFLMLTHMPKAWPEPETYGRRHQS